MEANGPDDERPGSPLLEKQEIRYKPSESPPPFLPEKSSSSSRDSTPHPVPGRPSRPSKKRRNKIRASQGDSVLIGYLGPNYPETAREARINPLASVSASQSEAEGSDDEGMPDRSDTPPNEQASDLQGAAKIAQDALNHIHQPLESSEQPILSHPRGIEPVVKDVTNVMMKKERFHPTDAKDTDDAAMGLQRFTENSQKSRRPTLNIINSSDENSADDSLVMSPNLRKNMIPASEGSPMQTLPAIQKSPPASASASSPDGAQKLPSIHTALAGADNSLNDKDVRMNGTSPVARTAFPLLPGQSPPLNRSDRIPPPFPSQHAPTTSPYPCEPSPQSGKDFQGMSPPGTSHPHLFRTKPEAPYTPATSISESQPTPQSTEGSSAYPTPVEHRMSIDGERPALINGPLPPNGPFTSSGFKCTHAGCTAQPFQTQYLLNSHANVHSQNRPHYCPVKGCNRGVGGRGFKRKNEMTRHGLVHESPGYVCPFCPDQQHRYPRPDNLQRHVRAHHGDQAKDDPQLRQVLAQRPEGGNRGRRRRMLP